MPADGQRKGLVLDPTRKPKKLFEALYLCSLSSALGKISPNVSV